MSRHDSGLVPPASDFRAAGGKFAHASPRPNLGSGAILQLTFCMLHLDGAGKIVLEPRFPPSQKMLTKKT